MIALKKKPTEARRNIYVLSKMWNQNAGRYLPDVRLPGKPDTEKDQKPENMGKARTLNYLSKQKRMISEVILETVAQK